MRREYKERGFPCQDQAEEDKAARAKDTAGQNFLILFRIILSLPCLSDTLMNNNELAPIDYKQPEPPCRELFPPK